MTESNKKQIRFPVQQQADKEPTQAQIYKYSFSIHIVRPWNSLPGSVVEAGSLSRFKSALKRFLNIP